MFADSFKEKSRNADGSYYILDNNVTHELIE